MFILSKNKGIPKTVISLRRLPSKRGKVSVMGQENVTKTKLYRCTGRRVRAAKRHNDSCCDL